MIFEKPHRKTTAALAIVLALLLLPAVRAFAADFVEQNPKPFGWDVWGMWGPSADSLYLVGEEGGAAYFNGSTFSVFDNLNTSGPLTDVWGSSLSNVWAVGWGLYRYNGTSWSANAAPVDTTYYGIWGTSANDIFAVGIGGVIVHYNGTRWMQMDSPTHEHLMDVWGLSSDDVYAVGFDGTILHYDGTDWSTVSSSTSADLRSIHGHSGWIYVGGDNGTLLRAPYGGSFSTINHGLSNLGQINDVYTNLGSVYMACTSGCAQYSSGSWSKISSDTLLSLAGFSQTMIMAGGMNGLVRLYNGSSWTTYSDPLNSTIDAMWGIDRDTMLAHSWATLMKYTESTQSWAEYGDSDIGKAKDMWGASANGYYIIDYRGIHKCSESNCNTLYSTGNLEAVWTPDNRNVYAVGESGKAAYCSGTTCETQATGTAFNLNGVFGSSTVDVVAVGDTGTTLHYNGSTWTSKASPTVYNLQDVWGPGNGKYIAVGDSGVILLYNGSSWSRMTSNITENLESVCGFSLNDVYAVGNNGTVMHYNGSTWSALDPGTGQHLTRVHCVQPDNVFIGGFYGTILYKGNGLPEPTQNIPLNSLYELLLQ